MDLTDPTPVATKDGFSIENFIEVEDPRTIELEVKVNNFVVFSQILKAYKILQKTSIFNICTNTQKHFTVLYSRVWLSQQW